MHEEIFPPENPDDVRELAGDGNEKILVKVCKGDAPKKRAGRPPQRRENPKPFGNGWFMVSDPRSGRILALSYMHEPENN